MGGGAVGQPPLDDAQATMGIFQSHSVGWASGWKNGFLTLKALLPATSPGTFYSIFYCI